MCCKWFDLYDFSFYMRAYLRGQEESWLRKYLNGQVVGFRI